MRFQIRKCIQCNRYTLKFDCPLCKGQTFTVHPAKFSPDDKYMKYRIAEKPK